MVRSADRPDVSTYYTVTHPEGQTADWRAFYDEIDRRTAATRDALPHELDIAYGAHPKQALDVYEPSTRDPAAPVFVFVHGGGFREGDRAHYGFVAAPFAANGIVTVVPGYRLMPDCSYFDAVDDVRAALAWVVERYGPSEVFVCGHSAGGVLAAFVGAARGGSPVVGFAGISAGYDFTTEGLPSYARARFADDRERRLASPLHTVADPAPRALVAVGSREESYLGASRAFADRLGANGVAVELLVLDGLGHDGTVLGLGEEQSPLSRILLEMMLA
jgi:acetyl esterase/lipase